MTANLLYILHHSTMYKGVYLALRHIFLPAEGLLSCSRPRGTQGARRNTTAQVWALADVRGTCSGGSKSEVPTGRHSEHVGPSRPLQTHVLVKITSDGSCDIWDFECHRCRQTLLTSRWKLFVPTPTCQTCDYFYRNKIHLHDLRRIWSLLTHMTTRWLGLFNCDPQLYEYDYVQGEFCYFVLTLVFLFKIRRHQTIVLSRIAVRV